MGSSWLFQNLGDLGIDNSIEIRLKRFGHEKTRAGGRTRLVMQMNVKGWTGRMMVWWLDTIEDAWCEGCWGGRTVGHCVSWWVRIERKKNWPTPSIRGRRSEGVEDRSIIRYVSWNPCTPNILRFVRNRNICTSLIFYSWKNISGLRLIFFLLSAYNNSLSN